MFDEVFQFSMMGVACGIWSITGHIRLIGKQVNSLLRFMNPDPGRQPEGGEA
jgi:hypothetical protein